MRIERHYHQYRIRLEGDRSLILADDVAELQAAVAHYYGDMTQCGMTSCPLCRHIAKQHKRTARTS
jgi:hypothetical protein